MPTSSTTSINTRSHTGGSFFGAVSGLLRRGRPSVPDGASPADLAMPMLQERAVNLPRLDLTVNTAWPMAGDVPARPALGILCGSQHGEARGARIDQWLRALKCTAPVADNARRAVERMPGSVPVDVACAALLLRSVSVDECHGVLRQLFSASDLAAALCTPLRRQTVARFRDAAWNQDSTKNLALEFAVIEQHIDKGIPPEIACVSMLYPSFEKKWAPFIDMVMPDEDAVAGFDSDGSTPLASPHSTLEPQ
jgi:hypothetical protein